MAKVVKKVHGATVQRYNGTMVQRCKGTAAQRHNGHFTKTTTFFKLTFWLFITNVQ